MPASAQFDDTDPARAALLGGRRLIAEPRLAYGLSEGQQIVAARLRGFVDGEPDHLPAARRGQVPRMPLAQVVAVRLRLGGEWPENSRGVGIDIGEGGNGRPRAAGPRTPSRPHAGEATGAGPASVGAQGRVQGAVVSQTCQHVAATGTGAGFAVHWLWLGR
jgi:hypothetical protein